MKKREPKQNNRVTLEFIGQRFVDDGRYFHKPKKTHKEKKSWKGFY